MAEFSFDVKLWATVHVQAATEKEAREKIKDQLDGMEINHDHDGLRFEYLTVEDADNDELIEIDGEATPFVSDDDNPFHPESPEGRAWENGDRSSVKP